MFETFAETGLYQLHIDGAWVDNEDGKRLAVENPSTGATVGHVVAANGGVVNDAVEAADAAFASWSTASPDVRGNYLVKAAGIVRERIDYLASMMTKEIGKPLNEARGEVRKGAEILQFYGEEAKRLHGERIPGFDASTTSYVIYEPLGVAAAISPWNYPIELVAWKIGAAIGSGCTLVIKPPSEGPIAPAAFAECLIDAGVPHGVVNIVFGSGADVGRALVQHQKVRKVAFTGSTEVGKQIAAWCGQQMKKVSLELGGHAPLIITKEADLAEAVKGATRRTFRNMGQICIAINRIYVAKEIYDDFLKAFADATSKLTIGDGLRNPSADLGPMASKSGLEKTERHVQDALSKGARLCTGGARPKEEEFRNGYYYLPTILADVTHEMVIMREETFGPAVGVMPFDTIDEAISLANDTDYGLAAYVYTNDLHQADQFIHRLEAGNVAINNPDAGVINAPYGGFKESGMGYEHGRAGMMEYVRAKHARVRYFWRDKGDR